MIQRYSILSEHFFQAIGSGHLSNTVTILRAGSLWCELLLTEEQAKKYGEAYPIEPLDVNGAPLTK